MSQVTPPADSPTEPESNSNTTDAEKPAPVTFDEAYVSALRKESAGHRTKANELGAELETLRATHEALSEELAAAKQVGAEQEATVLALTRRTIAAELGVPSALVSRLQGATEEELRADAATIVAALGEQRTVNDVGQSGTTPEAPASQGVRALFNN